MIRPYKLTLRRSEGLVVTEHPDYGRNLWARARVRKSSRCVLCDATTVVKATAYSPITHGLNRMHRICQACVDRYDAQGDTGDKAQSA